METIIDNLNLPVPAPKAEAIKAEFDFEYHQKIAAEWAKKASELVITDASQLKEMKLAGDGKKFLKTIRTSIEKKRKELKDNSLQEGRAIDEVAKFLTGLVEPIEKNLESKEKYAELLEKQRQQELHNQRYDEITPFLESIPVGINYGALDHGTYRAMFEYAKKDFEDRIALAEAERIAAELYQKKTELFYERRLKLAAYSSYGFFDLNEDTTEEQFQSYIQEGIEGKEAEDLEKENIRLENEKLKQEALAKESVRNARQQELSPYIQFIRDYNGLIEKEEPDYQKEFSEIKEGAKQQREFEAEEKIRIQAENDARQKEIDNLHLQYSRAKQLASIFSGIIPFDYDGDLLYKLTQVEFDTLYNQNKWEHDRLIAEEERIQNEKNAQLLLEEQAKMAAESAPDKEKLMALSKDLDEIDRPMCDSEIGIKTVNDVHKLILKIQVYIETGISMM